MDSRILKLAIPAVLGACLSACESPSEAGKGPQAQQPPASAPGAASAFDRSVMAIKAMDAGQKEKLAAIEALASRYGHILVPRADPDPSFHAEAQDAESPSGEALAKAAAVSKYYPKKGHNYGKQFILMTAHQVKPGQTLTSWTARVAGSTVDPFVVALYEPGGNSVSSPFQVNVAAWGDDTPDGLDPRITWQNNTGASQWVHIWAFAYSPSVSGEATLVSIVNGANPQTYSGEMLGLAVYDNNISSPAPAAGCTGPLSDRITMRTVSDGGWMSGAMLVNTQSMKGAVIYEDHRIQQTIDVAGPAMASGYPNFLLLFTTAQGAGAGSFGNYAGMQYQRYSCPN